MFIRISRLAGKQILSSQVINFNLVECMRATVTAHPSYYYYRHTCHLKQNCCLAKDNDILLQRFAFL